MPSFGCRQEIAIGCGKTNSFHAHHIHQVPQSTQTDKRWVADHWMTQQDAHQLVGVGKTLHHSTLQSRQTFSQIQHDLGSNRDKILSLCAGCTHFTHFYAVLNCILQPTRSSRWRHIREVREAVCKILWPSLEPYSRNSTQSRWRRHFRSFFRTSINADRK